MAGRYNGFARFFFGGDVSSAKVLASVGRKQMGVTLDMIEKLGLRHWVVRKRYPGLRAVVETYAVPPHTYNISIFVSTEERELEELCSAKGFLVEAPGFGTGFLEYPNYAEAKQSNFIDKLEAGYNNWYGEKTGSEYTILSWQASYWRYYQDLNEQSNKIFYRGCLYAEAPAIVQGVGIYEGKLVVVANGNMYTTKWNPDSPYGSRDPGWVEVSPTETIENNITFNASPNGQDWAGHYFETAEKVYTRALTLAYDPVNDVVSINTNTYTTGVASTTFNGYFNPIARDDTLTQTYVKPATLTDNSSYAYYLVDLVINPAYDGTNCDTTARALSVTKSGPFTIPKTQGTCFTQADVPAPPSNVLRYWYAGYDHDVTRGALKETVPALDPCADSFTEDYNDPVWGDSWDTDWTSTGEFKILKDYDKDGAPVELTATNQIGKTIYGELDENYRDVYEEVTAVHKSYFISVASTKADNLVTSLSGELSPTGIPCASALTGGVIVGGGWINPLTDVPSQYPTLRWYSSRTRTIFGANIVRDTYSSYAVKSYFAGKTIDLFEEDYYEDTRTDTTTDYAGSYDNTTTYTAGTMSSWVNPMYCLSGSMTLNENVGCYYGPGDSQTGQTITNPNPFHGSKTTRIYMELDLKEKIALIAETIDSVSGGAWSYETRLYWETPLGQFDILPLASGRFLDNGSAYQTVNVPDYCYYPYAKELVTQIFDNTKISNFVAMILPRDDEVLMYTRGTIDSRNFDKCLSLNTNAGTVIETAVDTNVISKLKAL